MYNINVPSDFLKIERIYSNDVGFDVEIVF